MKYGERWMSPIGDARDDEATVAMPDEHSFLHLLPLEHVQDVGDVHFQADVRLEQVRALRGAGEAGRVNGMAEAAQPFGDPAPFPSPVPSGVNQDEFGHAAPDGKERPCSGKVQVLDKSIPVLI